MRQAVLLVLLSFVLGASRTEYINITKKFDQIESGKTKPGSRVSLSSAELNAYVQTELPQLGVKGVRNPRVELHGNNTATGRALIDFVQLRRGQGKEPNWFLRTLLEGERDVSVTTRVQSAGGNATVYVERVEIQGVPIEGAALDFIIDRYLRPNYPKAKIGQPFALKHGIEKIEVSPGVAHVVMKR